MIINEITKEFIYGYLVKSGFMNNNNNVWVKSVSLEWYNDVAYDRDRHFLVWYHDGVFKFVNSFNFKYSSDDVITFETLSRLIEILDNLKPYHSTDIRQTLASNYKEECFKCKSKCSRSYRVYGKFNCGIDVCESCFHLAGKDSFFYNSKTVQDIDTYICVKCKSKQAEPETPVKWCRYCFWFELIRVEDYTTNKNFSLSNGEIKHEVIEIVKLENNKFHLRVQGGLFVKQKELISLMKVLIDNSEGQDDFIKQKNLDIVTNHHLEIKDYLGFYMSRGEGYIYLAKSKKYEDCYKIGLSTNPEKRIKVLSSILMHEIKADDCGLGEFLLHNALRDYNAKGDNKPKGREWFYLNQEQINYIKSITKLKDGIFHFNGEGTNG